MQVISLNYAANNFMKIVKQAQSGESIFLTENDIPVAKLSYIDKNYNNPIFGSAKGLIEMSEDFDAELEDFKEYMY